MLRTLLLLAIVGIAGYFVWQLSRGILMPETRDAHLKGKWVAKGKDSPLPRFREIVFLANGTAMVPGMSQIRWGTTDGVLHMIGRASGTDWLNTVVPYVLGNRNRSITFPSSPFGLLPTKMIRG